MRRALLLFVLAPACIQTTGGQIVDFPAFAGGRSDLKAGEPFAFLADDGWSIVLKKAVLHLGAVYLDQAAPVSGAQATPCILPGTYVAQVTTGMDIDLLSPLPQRFPVLAHGTTGQAIAGQLWLTGARDINDSSDTTTILAVEGTASNGGDVRPFTGQITIGPNRQISASPAGASPLCKQRIVTVNTDVLVAARGGLVVRIDVEKLFTNVDWSALPKFSDSYGFVDQPNHDQPSTNLYSNLHAGSSTGSPYTFTWQSDL